MRIVLDTNVLVSGLLSPFGTCARIVGMAASGELRLCLDARILSEYCTVLGRPKFGFDGDKTAALLDQIEHRGCTVAPGPLPVPLPDSDDDPFLEVAYHDRAAPSEPPSPPSRLADGLAGSRRSRRTVVAEVALAGEARCLVTGNLGHFPARLRRGVRVLSPAEFLTFYRRQMKG